MGTAPVLAGPGRARSWRGRAGRAGQLLRPLLREGAQHGAFLLPEVAWRRTATPSALRAHLWLFVACNRLIGVTSAGQIVAS